MSASTPVTREIEAGLRAHREGEFESALSHYQLALRLQPGNADALNLAGVALQQLGRPEQALENLRQAARLRRNDAAILANLGQLCATLNLHAEAEDAYRKASRIDARQPNYQLGLANALAQQGQYPAALTLFERLTQRYPDQPLLWFNRGNALRDHGRLTDALDSFRRSLALNATDLAARNNLAGVLHALLRFDEAEREYRACLAMDAHYLGARISLASLLIDVARDAEAETVCREVLQRDPDQIEAWLMLATAQNNQGRVNAQLDTLRAAIMRAPQHTRVVNAHASALFNAGHFAEAIRMVERAQTLEPDEQKKQDALAGNLLAYGYLEAGWFCYRHRPAREHFLTNNSQVTPAGTLPEDLGGAHCFVQREQGLGDELFFLRYAPLLAAKGARITYQAGAKLQTLLQRAPCLHAVLPEQAAIPAADYLLLAGDLPRVLTPAGVAQEQFDAACALAPGQLVGASASDSYPLSLAIAPLPERVGDMRQRLAAAGPAPYLGLTWRAGIPPREQGTGGWSLYKATAIAEFAQAVSAFPGTLLALQRSPSPGEIAAMAQAANRPVHDFTGLNDDLEDMLALLALIDEYAGVSNTNMHLRALAGKTARVLLPAPAEWRWMHSGDASPWFPGFSLYRQDHDGDWQAAWATLRRDLTQAWPAR
jgi:tetratricopeptide (TPR) repeat protein